MARRRKSHGLEGLINCFFEEATKPTDYIDVKDEDIQIEDEEDVCFIDSTKLLWSMRDISQAYIIDKGDGTLVLHCFDYKGDVDSYSIESCCIEHKQ